MANSSIRLAQLLQSDFRSFGGEGVRMKRLASAAFLVLASTVSLGCQQDIVQRRANRLTSTVPNMYYEQVLDNLAIAQTSPDILPYFGVPTQGTHTNSRQYQGSYAPGFDLVFTGTLRTRAFLERWLFDKQTAMFQGTIQNQEAFQLQPVSNPDKLLLMQTAFQLATGNSKDPIMERRLREFFGQRNVFFDYWPGVVDKFYIATDSRKEAYKYGCYVGRCGGTYLYVPRQNLAALSKFTLAILNIVTVDDKYIYTDPAKPGSGIPREPRFPFPTPPVAPTL
jgi:hypothetical protein